MIIIGGIIGAVLAAATGAAGVVLLGLVIVGGWVVILVGWWKLTEPDPSGIGEEEYGTARKIIRVALIVGVANQVLSMIPTLGAPPPSVRVAIQIVSFLLGIVAVIGIFAQLQYLGKLSLRIPDDSLAGRARFLMYGLGISYAVMIVFSLVIVLAASGGGGTPAPALGAMGCFLAIVGIAVLVMAVMYLFLIERIGRRLGEEASAAEQSWARGGVPAPPMPPPA